MPGQQDLFPEQLIAYLQMVGIIAARGVANPILALAAMLESTADDLLEDTRRYLVDNWVDLVRLDVSHQGLIYHENELRRGRANNLLVEAVCRMRHIQLILRQLGAPANTSRIFGEHGRVYEAVEVEGKFFALLEPIIPWHEEAIAEQCGMAAKIFPVSVEVAGPSGIKCNTARVAKAATLPKICKLRPRLLFSPRIKNAKDATQRAARRLFKQALKAVRSRVRLATAPVIVRIGPVAENATTDNRRDNNEGPIVTLVRQEELPFVALEAVMQRGQILQEMPQNISIELVAPQSSPYEQLDGAFVCRLPGCPTPDRPFRTLKGWKLHAIHTRKHVEQGYCTGCGNFILAPPQIGLDMKEWLKAHRRERCAGASKQVVRERRREMERLQHLWRDASHIHIPGEQRAQEEETPQRRAQKRAYTNDEDRRVALCISHIKRFKVANPARLEQIAADFELTIR